MGFLISFMLDIQTRNRRLPAGRTSCQALFFSGAAVAVTAAIRASSTRSDIENVRSVMIRPPN
jgi:hypothetical protein